MEPQCGFCKKWGPLEQFGQLYHTRIKEKTVAAHHKCMQYSAGLSQFKFDHFGGFKVNEVEKELRRGRKLRCNECHKSGATAGCAVKSCRKTYHFPCAPRHERIEKTMILYRVFCDEEHEDFYKEHINETSEMVDCLSDSENDGSDAEPTFTISDSEDNPDQSDTDSEHSVKLPVRVEKPPKKPRVWPRGRPRKKRRGSWHPVVKLPAENPPKRQGEWSRGKPSMKRRGRPPKVKLPESTVSIASAAELKTELHVTQVVPMESRRGISPIEQIMDDATTARYKPKTAWVARQAETQAHVEKRKRSDSESSDSDSGPVGELKHADTITDGDSSDMRLEQTRVTRQPAGLNDSSSTTVSEGTNDDSITAQVEDSPNSSYEVKSKAEAKVVLRRVTSDIKVPNSAGNTREKKRKSSNKCLDDYRDISPSQAKQQLYVSHQNLDGTEMDTGQHYLIPTPEASGSENSIDHLDHVKNDQDIEIDSNSVVLLIPSSLKVPDEELAAFHKDVGISRTQSIVWPSLDKQDSLKEEHLVHFMLDIVTSIRDDDWTKVQCILNNINTEKYDYLLEYLTDKENEKVKNITKQYLQKVAEKLNGSHKTAFLKSRKFKDMAILVVPLTSSRPEHQIIISSLQSALFQWNNETSLRNALTKPHRREEELELLWRWFMGEIRTEFHSESYPRIQTLCPIEKLLYDESCSSEVVKELTNNLSDLQQRLAFNSNAPVAIIAVNGVNRQFVKYKYFVRQLIKSMTEESDSNQLYFIVSVDQSDELEQAGEILPDHLYGAAKMYSAFSPEDHCVSCLVVHITKTEYIQKDSFSEGNCSSSISYMETSESPSSVVTRQESADIIFSVVKTDDAETMYFHPVDREWQEEKADMLGLKVKTVVPPSPSGIVSRLEAPDESVSIRKDGNCYFRAICHLLTGNQREHKTVRQLIYRYMVENDDEISKLADCPNYTQSVSMNKDGVWATEIEIFATATMLATDVCVYSPCGHDTVGDTIYKWLTYTPLRNVSPLEGIRQLRNTNKWLTYKQVQDVVSPDSYRKHRKAIYLSNVADHYVPVYRLGQF